MKDVETIQKEKFAFVGIAEINILTSGIVVYVTNLVKSLMICKREQESNAQGGLYDIQRKVERLGNYVKRREERSS